MSHFTTIKTQIQDERALQAACGELGLQLLDNTTANGISDLQEISSIGECELMQRNLSSELRWDNMATADQDEDLAVCLRVPEGIFESTDQNRIWRIKKEM